MKAGICLMALFTTCVLLPLSSAADQESTSKVKVQGGPKQLDTQALDTGADLLQSRPPIEALNAYLDGFHFYNGAPDQQMEAHHYCAILSEELIQCVIYDGNVADAKLMGVEYIISERLFRRLPEEEKTLWHSHVHEVKSGQLIAPGIPKVAEKALMRKLVSTYGKTWHTWHTDKDKQLPLGMPQLMMGFTAEGQANQQMVRQRDQRFEINSSELQRERDDIKAPPVAPGADAWRRGNIIQINDPTGTHTHSTSIFR